jgi:hypothetical protein
MGCSARSPATPIETFKTYIKAIKAKDADAMRLLLSEATLKMHEQEAKSQGTTLDEIILREPLYNDGQRTIEFKDEKIEGERATLEVRNSSKNWQTVQFVLENGAWKIDKKGFFDDMIREVEDSNQRIDETINNNIDTGIEPGIDQVPDASTVPDTTPTPVMDLDP